MTDVLKVALERQRELREEVEGIDEFIRMAEDLLRTARRAGSSTDGQESESESEHETESVPVSEPEDAAVAATNAPDADPGPRRFPWTGVEPAVRKTGEDDQGGPIRRNVFRRDISAAS